MTWAFWTSSCTTLRPHEALPACRLRCMAPRACGALGMLEVLSLLMRPILVVSRRLRLFCID